MSLIEAIPNHPYNDKLINNVAPPTWVNPKPSGRYNLVVFGAGSAGLVAAAGAAGIGAKVALIEKTMMGGDCLNVGCVPSKALIKSAKIFGDLRAAEKLGVHIPDGVTVDFKKVMERVWKVRSDIAPHDSAERYTKLGVDVFFGEGKFTGSNTVEIGGQTLEFKKALIATGSRPLVIPIPGLENVDYLTNETIWNLTKLPPSMAIIGAGPIGCELAQSFQRFGSRVTLIDIAPQILPREDRDAAAIVENALLEDGVTLCLDAKTQMVSERDGMKVLEIEKGGERVVVSADTLLLAVGRAANIEGLNLEAAGIESHRKGITVDDYLKTTNSDVYAAGDVATKYQFTHTAGHMAAIVVQNALFPAPKRKMSDLVIPWATYTDPEIAHVGLYAHEAEAQGIAIDTYHIPMGKTDRGMADGEEDGFVKIHTKQGKGHILGATIVARHAGDLITEITMAMKYKLGLGKITSVIHPYPTQSEAIHKAAGEYMKTRLTPTAETVLNRWLQFTR